MQPNDHTHRRGRPPKQNKSKLVGVTITEQAKRELDGLLGQARSAGDNLTQYELLDWIIHQHTTSTEREIA